MAWIISIVFFWYHKCVCGILLRKLKKYSIQNYGDLSRKSMTHIYDVLFEFSHRMTYAGLVKRVKSHFENCNNGPDETPVQGDCSYILTPRRPRGPNVKQLHKTVLCNISTWWTHFELQTWSSLNVFCLWKCVPMHSVVLRNINSWWHSK